MRNYLAVKVGVDLLTAPFATAHRHCKARAVAISCTGKARWKGRRVTFVSAVLSWLGKHGFGTGRDLVEASTRGAIACFDRHTLKQGIQRGRQTVDICPGR